jgi:hypothetical protein
MSPIRRALLLTVALAAAALAAGCAGGSLSNGSAGSTPAASVTTTPSENGVADLSAPEILAKAREALGEAGSVHIKGSGTSKGTPFALDMRYGQDGATGSFSANVPTVELLRVGSTVYMKSSEDFWRSSGGPAAAELLKGKYLEVSASTPTFASLARLTDLRKAAQDFLSLDGTETKGERKTIRGVDAIGLNSSNGAVLYVAVRGKPYPVKAVSTGDGESAATGSIDFLDYGVPVTVTAPPSDQVVVASKLGVR